MRVGIDVSPLTLARTGVGQYTHALLRQLLRLGDGTEFRGLSSGLGAMDAAALEGLAAHRHVRVPTRALYQAWSCLRWPKADRLIGGVDVYHATNYFLPPTSTARRVVTIYDLAFLRVPALCSPKIVGPFSRGVRRFAREADAILVCSEATRRDVVELLEVPEQKTAVAHGAVDEDFVPVPRDEAARILAGRYGIETPFLLFVSTIEPRKNVPGLLRAFARVSDEFPHQLVLIGGTGWNSEDVDPLIAELGIASRVRRMGYLPNRRDLPLFYSAADCFVFPSFYEGFGLPVLEAMTCGCPVVTSKRSSLPEVAGDAAAYADPEDVESIAGAVRAVLADASRRDAMRVQGLSQAQRFSWEHCARVTMEMYRRLAP